MIEKENKFKARRHIYIVILLLSFFFEVAFCHAKNNPISFFKIEEILKNKNHGDTIYIKNGIYRNLNLTLKNFKPVVIMAESSGNVVIEGNVEIVIQSSERLTFSNFLFQNIYSKMVIKINNSKECVIEENYFEDISGNTHYSRVIGIQKKSRNNIIRKNTFDKIKAMGITIRDKGSVHNKIINNEFKNVPKTKEAFPNSDGNGMESIQIGTKDNKGEILTLNTSVSNNIFKNIYGDGNEVISVKSNNNNIENNNFYSCRGGITLRYGNVNKILNNYFKDTDQPIRIFGKNHSIKGNRIVNANVAIQLPSSNIHQEEEMNRKVKASPMYIQSENIIISDNIIYNSRIEDIEIGRHYSGKRNKLPSQVLFQNNYSEKKIKFYFKGAMDGVSIKTKLSRVTNDLLLPSPIQAGVSWVKYKS